MFRNLEDFRKGYDTLTEGTGKILGQLTDENIGQRVTADHRTVGQIAWHIVTSVPEMMNRTGLGMSSVDPESSPPSSAREIADGYAAVAAELNEALRSKWTNDSLLQTDDMYGEQWPRGLTLSILLSHEIHHRGQMTVLLRQAGVPVPGVFGPSKEEWTRYGMPEPPY